MLKHGASRCLAVPSTKSLERSAPAFFRPSATRPDISLSLRLRSTQRKLGQPFHALSHQYAPRLVVTTRTPATLFTRQYATRRWGTLRQNINNLSNFPGAAPTAVLILALCCAWIFYKTWYANQPAHPFDELYPAPVAKPLKRALFHQFRSLDAEKSLMYYKQALQAAQDLGISPLDPDIISIKVELGRMLEKFHQEVLAIKVLERSLDECNTWLNTVATDLISTDNSDHKPDTKQNSKTPSLTRTNVLKASIALNSHLGDLYSHSSTNSQDTAHKHYTTAAELALRETARRAQEGSLEGSGSGEWLPPTQLCAILAKLGDSYESQSQFYLAAPLYLRAITLSPPRSCATATLMNNLASCLAQSAPETLAASVSDEGSSGAAPAASRPALIANARAWAEQAITLTAKVGAERTEECDVACAVATHNLGEFAEMEGMVEEARKRYREAESLARGLGFEEGVGNAVQALGRVERRREEGERDETREGR